MSSHGFVSSQRTDPANGAISLGGAALWTALAILAGLHRVGFGIIELLFLFAPLVIVPLGIELTRTLEDTARPPLDRFLRTSQVAATVGACIAMWLPPGHAAALLSGLWLLQCALLAGLRIVLWQREEPSLLRFLLDIAHVDLVIGAAWLVISRAAWRPMGFQEPIILLTAIHFHYSGFGTAIIAATTLRWFQNQPLTPWWLRALLLCIVLLPFAVAAGFVFSPALRLIAALALSTCATALAFILLWVANHLRNVHARVHLRLAACAVISALFLSGAYAVSEYFGKGWITIPLMANTHGVVNSLGFVLLAMLGWRTELNVSDSADRDDSWRNVKKSSQSPKDGLPFRGHREPYPGTHPSALPEFIARDFYDR
jgi:hypothetical protein